MRARISIGGCAILALVTATAADGADIILFADNFNCCELNPLWVASLPNAYWRYQAKFLSPPGIAEFIGEPNYSFETADGASVIRLTNTLNNAQRVGLSTYESFDGGLCRCPR